MGHWILIYIYEGSERNSHIESERKPQHVLCKIKKTLYGLKQSGRMWYNRLSEFFLAKGYTSSDDSPCVFIEKSDTGFCIISVYVDDLNIIGHI